MNALRNAFMLLCAATSVSPALDGTLTPRPLGGDPDCPYGYLEYLPVGYSTSTSAQALVLSFHGKGREGDGKADLAKLTENGPGKLISAGRDFPAIILCPQAAMWYDVAQVDRFLSWARRQYRIDDRRIYLVGYSAGGSQVWNYAHAHPDVPAAIIPICGASDPENPKTVKDPGRLAAIPVWAFHCFDDETVNRRNTIRWMNGIARAGGQAFPDIMDGYPGVSAGDSSAVQIGQVWRWTTGIIPGNTRTAHSFTLYAAGGHDAWTRTYANDAVWDWLFAQHRPDKERR